MKDSSYYVCSYGETCSCIFIAYFEMKGVDGRYVIGFDNGYQFGKTAGALFDSGVYCMGKVEPFLKEHSLKYARKHYKALVEYYNQKPALNYEYEGINGCGVYTEWPTCGE